jgi:hypothetical protein
MTGFIRSLVFNFSAVTCPREKLDAHDTCVNEIRDMNVRIQSMCAPFHSECSIIDEHLKSKKLYTSITDEIEVKDLMQAFLCFDDDWRQQVTAIEGQEDPLANQFKYQHVNYLSRTAERFDKAYNQLGAMRQQALSYVYKPEASMMAVMLHYGAQQIDRKQAAQSKMVIM